MNLPMGSIMINTDSPGVDWVPGYPSVRQTHVLVNTRVITWSKRKEAPPSAVQVIGFPGYVLYDIHILLANADTIPTTKEMIYQYIQY